MPPGRFDRRYHSGSGWRRFLPGVWEPPTGWGKTVDGVDAFVWVIWWLIRAHPDKFSKAALMMLTRVRHLHTAIQPWGCSFRS